MTKVILLCAAIVAVGVCAGCESKEEKARKAALEKFFSQEPVSTESHVGF
ncbi:hypothetical protein [Bartonella sp. CB178]